MSIDNRRFPRVEFFLVPEAHEEVPDWAIKAQNPSGARGGVVVNLSEAGLQVLCAAEPVLDAPRYELRLLLGEENPVPLFNATVRRVWTRPLSKIVQLCGFEFESENSQAEEFLLAQTVQVTPRRWVRCELVERVTATA
jgi:hypothetical protein